MRAPKATITNKINTTCPVFANITRKNDKIYVAACLTHIGHDDLLKRIPLSETDRQGIATLLMQERSADWIVQHEQGCTIIVFVIRKFV